MRTVYLDNNATTAVAPEVLTTMLPYFTERFGNPSSLHQFGIQSDEALAKARQKLSQQLSATSSHRIIFTASGTESNHLAIYGIAKAYQRLGKHIITTHTEHKSTLASCASLKAEGFDISFADVDQYGKVIPESIYSLIQPNTILIAILHANNELGSINPINEIAKKCKSINAYIQFISDGVQAFGKISCDLTHIDAYSISGHKFHAPKGIAALAVNNQIKIHPIIPGGNQEFGLRAGTENLPAIIGLAAASEIAYQQLQSNQNHFKILKQYFLNAIKSLQQVEVNSPVDGLDNTLNLSFLGIPSEVLMQALNEKGVYVSAGAACDSNQREPSHVLKACKLSKPILQSAIRFSFSKYTTLDELEYTITQLKSILEMLRPIIAKSYFK